MGSLVCYVTLTSKLINNVVNINSHCVPDDVTEN